MGRKFNLKKTSQRLLQKHKQGSPVTIRDRQRVMDTIIDDLAALKQLPASFQQFSAKHIETLVDHWRDKGLSTATIGNKLGVLRSFSQLSRLHLDIPSNKALNSIKASPVPSKTPLPENCLDKVYHPITRSIIELQILFGLTKLEAIRLQPDGAYIDNTLFIYRSIAHNKRDRAIPVTSKEQERCLQNRITVAEGCGLFDGDPSETLMDKLYRAECQYANIDPKTPFRKRYAERRINTLKETMDARSALLAMCDEMGFSATRKLSGLLP